MIQYNTYYTIYTGDPSHHQLGQWTASHCLSWDNLSKISKICMPHQVICRTSLYFIKTFLIYRNWRLLICDGFLFFFLSLYFSLGTNQLIVNQLLHMYRNKEKPKGAKTRIEHFSDEMFNKSRISLSMRLYINTKEARETDQLRIYMLAHFLEYLTKSSKISVM